MDHNKNEQLQEVIIGRCDNLEKLEKSILNIDPITAGNLTGQTMPNEESINRELITLTDILEKNGITIHRPKKNDKICPLFVRDLGCMIDGTFIKTRPIWQRESEFISIDSILRKRKIEPYVLSKETSLEGGDMILWNDIIFMGYSEDDVFGKTITARTNIYAVEEIEKKFHKKKVIGLQIKKSESEPKENGLHLDCVFMPLGNRACVMHERSFTSERDVALLHKIFSDQIITVNDEEMIHFACNILQISENHFICSNSTSIGKKIRKLGFEVTCIDFTNCEKLGGGIRCVSLPIK